MATYKKRGHKPKTKAEKEIQIEEGSRTAEVFKSLDAGASKPRHGLKKNQKVIFGVIGAIALVVWGTSFYQKFFQEPKQMEAANEVYQPVPILTSFEFRGYCGKGFFFQYCTQWKCRKVWLN